MLTRRKSDLTGNFAETLPDDLFGANFYCHKDPFGCLQYCTKNPFGAKLYGQREMPRPRVDDMKPAEFRIM